MAAGAFKPAYHDRVARGLRCCRAIIVSNTLMKRQLDGFHDNVHIFPGGVDTSEFAAREPEPRDRAVILMAGRAEDPMKGAQTLREAADALARERSDFEVHVIPPRPPPEHRALQGHRLAEPCRPPRALCGIRHLRRAVHLGGTLRLGRGRRDGLGPPPCAPAAWADCKTSWSMGETGFLFERGDSQALAERLGMLLDDSALRIRMGPGGAAPRGNGVRLDASHGQTLRPAAGGTAIMTLPKRIAFVDLYFCWPPHGGADVDLYHVIRGVQDLDYDVHLFVSNCDDTFERGTITPSELPFPTTRIDFERREITQHVLPPAHPRRRSMRGNPMPSSWRTGSS